MAYLKFGLFFALVVLMATQSYSRRICSEDERERSARESDERRHFVDRLRLKSESGEINNCRIEKDGENITIICNTNSGVKVVTHTKPLSVDERHIEKRSISGRDEIESELIRQIKKADSNESSEKKSSAEDQDEYDENQHDEDDTQDDEDDASMTEE